MDEMDKCMKEVKKGITVETFKSGDSKGVKATNEIGSKAYPCEESILNKPDLLEHGY